MAICCKQKEAWKDKLLQHAWWQNRSHKKTKEQLTCRETMNNGEPTKFSIITMTDEVN